MPKWSVAAFGLGNRLTSYSSMIQMPQFFAVVLILSILGILIYVLFSCSEKVRQLGGLETTPSPREATVQGDYKTQPSTG